jgi:hypothetical protein
VHVTSFDFDDWHRVCSPASVQGLPISKTIVHSSMRGRSKQVRFVYLPADQQEAFSCDEIVLLRWRPERPDPTKVHSRAITIDENPTSAHDSASVEGRLCNDEAERLMGVG